MTKHKRLKKKAKPHNWWVKKTNADFNKWIRLRDVDKYGYITCVTCSKKVHWKEANAGHFKHGLDFIDFNQHGQCRRCNHFLSGNLDKYALFMIDRYGRETVDWLEKEKHKVHKYKISELRDMREEYKKRIKKLKEGLL